MTYEIRDIKTGTTPDLEDIVKEGWAEEIRDGGAEDFAVTCDGTLLLIGKRGTFVYCPEGRFRLTKIERRSSCDPAA